MDAVVFTVMSYPFLSMFPIPASCFSKRSQVSGWQRSKEHARPPAWSLQPFDLMFMNLMWPRTTEQAADAGEKNDCASLTLKNNIVNISVMTNGRNTTRQPLERSPFLTEAEIQCFLTWRTDGVGTCWSYSYRLDSLPECCPNNVCWAFLHLSFLRRV